MDERKLYSFCRNCSRTDCEGLKRETFTCAGVVRDKLDGCVYQERITPNAGAELYGIAQDLRKLEALENYSNHTEEAYSADPENEEKESRFDEAYKKEFSLYMELSGQLAQLLQIEEKTARAMVKTKRREILQILARRATA